MVSIWSSVPITMASTISTLSRLPQARSTRSAMCWGAPSSRYRWATSWSMPVTAQSIRPRWWFPHALIDTSRWEVGAVTGGSDTLNRHLYAVDAAYDAKNHWGVGSIDYIYDRWTPIFKLHADSTSDVSLDSNGDLVKIRRETSGVAEIATPLLSYYNRWA